jgi:hypothetical protein
MQTSVCCGSAADIVTLSSKYTLRWPDFAKRETRVALAIRNDALDRYVFEERTDLVDSPHVQCLDVWETANRRKIRRTGLINIYNNARVKATDIRLTT